MEVLNIGLDQKCPEYSSPNLTNKKKIATKLLTSQWCLLLVEKVC